jgi:hypothetical protein
VIGRERGSKDGNNSLPDRRSASMLKVSLEPICGFSVKQLTFLLAAFGQEPRGCGDISTSNFGGLVSYIFESIRFDFMIIETKTSIPTS